MQYFLVAPFTIEYRYFSMFIFLIKTIKDKSTLIQLENTVVKYLFYVVAKFASLHTPYKRTGAVLLRATVLSRSFVTLNLNICPLLILFVMNFNSVSLSRVFRLFAFTTRNGDLVGCVSENLL